MSVVLEAFQAPSLQRALLAATIVGLVGGTVGVHVRLRRLAFVTDALTHTVLPGIAIAFALDGSLFLGAAVAAAASAGGFTVLSGRPELADDAALAVVLSSFFAAGVVIVSRSEGYAGDLGALLFGRILTVSRGDVVTSAAAGALAGAVVAVLHKELVLFAFDPGASEAHGYRRWALDLALNGAVALAVVAGSRAMGTLLVVAMLVVPAATAALVCDGVERTMAWSAAVAVASATGGLVASDVASRAYGWRLPPAATAATAASVAFLTVLASTVLLHRSALVPTRPGRR